VELSDIRWREDMDRFVRALSRRLEPSEQQREAREPPATASHQPQSDRPADTPQPPDDQTAVERVRTALEAFNRDGPEAGMAWLAPDVEWIADRSDMGRVTYRGPDGVRKSFEELYEGFDRLRFEADKLLEAGDQVVALGQMYARGRSTGFEAQIPLALVYTVGRDGKLIRYESFRNTEEALEAVGLRG
jgi:ketosteroid isomerase-like protein